MKTFKLILPPALYKAAKEAAKSEGIGLDEFCQRVSPVPVEVYVQPKIPRFNPSGSVFKEPLDNMSGPDCISSR